MNALIVCYAQNGCIGKENKMLWSLSKDMQRFRTLTINNVVVMGANTFESVGFLKNRFPIVVTHERKKKYLNDYAKIDGMLFDGMPAPEDIRRKIAFHQYKDIFYIGGESIYRTVLNNMLADTLFLTKIISPNKDFESGDTFFDESLIDTKLYREVLSIDMLDSCKKTGLEVETKFMIFRKI